MAVSRNNLSRISGCHHRGSHPSQVPMDQIAAHALQLDSTDPAALKEAGIFEFDTVIVAKSWRFAL